MGFCLMTNNIEDIKRYLLAFHISSLVNVSSDRSLELQNPFPQCTLIRYATSHNKALPFNTNRAHMMHMDSLANQRYYRCCNCAIKTDKKNTHP